MIDVNEFKVGDRVVLRDGAKATVEGISQYSNDFGLKLSCFSDRLLYVYASGWQKNPDQAKFDIIKHIPAEEDKPEEPEMYSTETIAQSVDGLTLISLKYSLQLCKKSRDELNKKRDMNAGNQEDWNTVVQDIHALERVIKFYGG